MINSPHPAHAASREAWSRVRNVLAGEDAVKAAAEVYLPRIHSHSNDEYDAYKKRSIFFNATARTAEGYVGLIFRRPPNLTVPEDKSPLAQSIATFIEDADLLGTS